MNILDPLRGPLHSEKDRALRGTAGTAHTKDNVVTAAVFHAQMFALKSTAPLNVCEPNHIYTSMNVYRYLYVHTNIDAYVHTYMHVCVSVCV